MGKGHSMKKHLPDALIITGAASVSAGAYAWHPAIGLIVAGVLLLIAGINLAGAA